MSITERLAEYISHKGLNNNKVTVQAGLSVGLLGKAIKNNAGLNSETIDKILHTFVDLNPSWLLNGDGNMLKSPSNTKTSVNAKLGIPLIPIEAMAGWGVGSTQVMNYEGELYKVPEFTELKVDFLIRVKGNSMYPKYSSGDLVACKRLTLETFFQWNKVYVLDTEQGALIKRVKQGSKKDTVTLISENSSYDPFELPKDKIYTLAIVVGVIRLE